MVTPGPHPERHLPDGLGDHAARGAQGGQLIRIVDGHPVILTDLMSSATFTRPSRGDVLELTIDSLAHGGNGVARREGYVVFVAGAVPGDRVRAEVGKAKKAYAEARAIEIVEPSPDRVPEFADHPGAPWQVLPYERQLAVKAEQVEDALRRIGKLDGGFDARADRPGRAGVALPQQARVLVRDGSTTASSCAASTRPGAGTTSCR